MKFSLDQTNWTRRHCIALSLAGAAVGIGGAAAAAVRRSPGPTTLLVLGDSISAEYGLRRGSGWVALLETRLAAQRIDARVINASISGDTTAGGRARLPALLAQHRPALLVIELGANDALRGLPLEQTRDNLAAMIEAARKAGARVLLLGMQLPPNYGREFGARFAQLYADLARRHRVGLVPFLLAGMADAPDSLRWFQADQLHPTEAAQPRLLDNVWPELKKGLP